MELLDTVMHKLQLLHCFFRMKISNVFLLWWSAFDSTFHSHKKLRGNQTQQKNVVLLHNLLTQNVYIKAHFIFSWWASFFMEFFHFINSNYCDSFCVKHNPVSLMLVTQRRVKSLSKGIKNAFHLLSSLFNSQFMCTTAPAALCKCVKALTALTCRFLLLYRREATWIIREPELQQVLWWNRPLAEGEWCSAMSL